MDSGIAIIGAGRVGCSFGIGLKKEGFNITGIYSRTNASFLYLARRLGMLKYIKPDTKSDTYKRPSSETDVHTGTGTGKGSGTGIGSMADATYENDLKSAVRNSNLILITVPDDSIEAVAGDIVSLFDGNGLSGKIFMHCSGAMGSDKIDILAESGAYTGSFHPIQTFPDRSTGWKSLYKAGYSFEGNEAAGEKARLIVKAFKGNLLYIRQEGKTLYHAAACVFSNYLVVLSHISAELLKSAGMEDETGIRAIMPLVKQTLENIGELGPGNALTGPVLRGDVLTVEKHIKELELHHPSYIYIYRALGIIALDMATRRIG